MTTHRLRPDIICACALVLLAVVFWSPWLVGGRVPVPADQQTGMLPWAAEQSPVAKPAQWDALWWDGVAQFFPWRKLLHDSLQKDRWPLWSETQFCGYPFVGNGQSAMFYPLNWIYGCVDTSRGLVISALLHYVLAMLLTFGFCRIIGLNHGASIFGAIAFAFGGFMVGWVPLPTLMNTATWLPGCLLGVELLHRRKCVPGVLCLGVCAGMTILAGHFQIATYVLLTTGLYTLARIIYNLIRHRSVPVAGFCAAFAIFGLLAAVQILPTFELGSLSPRGSGKPTADVFAFHAQAALRPIELLNLLQPDALGSPAGQDYVGLGIARGAAFGERCGFVGIITLVFALCALVVPGARPWRIAFFIAALLALWACMGGLPAKLIFYGVPKIGLTGGFARLLCLYTFFLAITAAFGLQTVLEQVKKSPVFASRGGLLTGLALIFLCFELLSFAWRELPAVPASRLYPQTQLSSFLGKDSMARYFALTPRKGWGLLERPPAVLPPNSATAYGLRDVQGYDSLYPQSYRRFATWLEGGEISPLANGNMMLLENMTSPLLDIVGVKWFIMPVGAFAGENISPTEIINGCQVLENKNVFPMAWLVTGVLSQELLQTRDEAAHEALLNVAKLPASERPALNCKQMSAGCLQLSEVDNSGLVMLGEACYPGWKAWADGQPVAVTPAGQTLLSVELKQGVKNLLLAYVPATVQCGLYLLLLGLAAIAGLCVFMLVNYLSPARGVN